MPEVRSVIAQIRPAGPGETGQITTGFYVIEDGVLTMTRPNGEPVDEVRYRHALTPADDEKRIAAVFTKEIRKEMLGEVVPGFSRHLSYPNAGLA
jgi:hypothetical protein